jgi:hypothetical protein
MHTIYNIRNCSTDEAQAELKGTNCMNIKGDCQDWVYSDQMVLKAIGQGGWTTWVVAKGKSRGLSGWNPLRWDASHDGQIARLDCDRWPKTPKTKLSSKKTTRLESTQIIWFSWLSVRRLDLATGGQWYSNESWETTLNSQGIYLKWHSDILKAKLSLLFIRGILKKVRWCRWRWWGENHNSYRLVWQQLRTEEPFIEPIIYS